MVGQMEDPHRGAPVARRGLPPRRSFTGSSTPWSWNHLNVGRIDPAVRKRGEHERDGLFDPLVRILHESADRVERVPRRDHPAELSFARLVVGAREQTLSQNLELDHAERTLDVEHELIIQLREVVEVLAVADKRLEYLTDLEKATPATDVMPRGS